MAAEALVEEVAEEVALNLEEAAQATRNIDARGVSFFLGGVCVGIAVGFYFGYRFNREKIKAEAYKQSKEEVEKIREVYQQKTVAAQQKPSVAEVIEERGYSTAVIIEEVKEEPERFLKPPVPVAEPKAPSIVYEGGKSKDEGWNYQEEISRRRPHQPFIIHQDEYMGRETGYSQVNYTYYAGDDVLVDEDNRPLPYPQDVVGQDNLRFGHGTDDIDVVFVRNNKLQIEMEISRSPDSYAEEVLGLERDTDETD